MTPSLIPAESYQRIHSAFVCETCGEKTVLSLIAFRHKSGCKAVGGVTALNAREKQLAELIAQGKTTKQMAEILDIQHGYVCKQRAYLYRRLGINSAAELVRLLFDYGILKPKGQQ